jgi:coenzyme PQQ biosynthesis probable peptidase PqqF
MPLHPPTSLLLDNGLTVHLQHRPHLKHAAAWLRVAAGSHDVPTAWPGLAHFLEHLFFLAPAQPADGQGLMAFVQRQGGQVNARTNERCTDFFFEVPPGAFAGGLRRLCGMLAAPCLGLPEQRREREVLHAEFIAWQRAPATGHEQWLHGPLNPAHPLRGFHAGNRYSLTVPNPAFQQALRDFYQRYYQTGQMTLCLAGPQPLERLRALAEDASRPLRAGVAVAQQPPPALMTVPAGAGPRADVGTLHLVFACEGLPAGDQAALDFLATWIASPHPGGLLDECRRRQLASSLALKVRYRFAGQALLDIELGLSAQGRQATGQVAALCLDWLECFRDRADWPGLREEYALLEQRRLSVAGALETARQSIERPGPTGLDESGRRALGRLLEQLRAKNLIHPLEQPLATVAPVAWQSPPPNRFLRAATRRAGNVPALPAMRCLPGPMPGNQQAAVRLRWQFAERAPSSLLAVVDGALATLKAQAAQAGFVLALSGTGREWTLSCSGVASALPELLGDTLAVLRCPGSEAWQEGPLAPTPLIPIRELLAQLPRQLTDPMALEGDAPLATPDALHSLWAAAHWEGLVMGLERVHWRALADVLQQTPGIPLSGPAALNPGLPARHWRHLPTLSSEPAVLVFCPVPDASLASEARWRLLNHLSQAAFYQRLRVELQLGYAVFSDFLQIAGQGGLLFGVQSPTTPVAELLNCIEVFIENLPARIATLDASEFATQQHTLATRFVLDELTLTSATELLWQAHLAGHGDDALDALRQNLLDLRQEALVQAAQTLAAPHARRAILANTSP